MDESDIACEPGRFGVREPRGGRPAVDVKQLDLILVPGLGFDRRGGRLGRGRGYYDRLLSCSVAKRIGVAFTEQCVPEAPVEPHDMRMNCIVSPAGWSFVAADSAALD